MSVTLSDGLPTVEWLQEPGEGEGKEESMAKKVLSQGQEIVVGDTVTITVRRDTRVGCVRELMWPAKNAYNLL